MSDFRAAIDDFLAQSRIAVAGVSREGQSPANAIFTKLRENGYTVYALNPHAGTIDGITCYPDLASLPEPVDGVVAVTPPPATEALAHACVELGIPRLWIHRSVDQSSYSEAGVQYALEHGVTVIPWGCPMMYVAPDVAHRCMRWLFTALGRFPKEIEAPHHPA